MECLLQHGFCQVVPCLHLESKLVNPRPLRKRTCELSCCATRPAPSLLFLIVSKARYYDTCLDCAEFKSYLLWQSSPAQILHFPRNSFILKIYPSCEAPQLECGFFPSRKEFMPLQPQSELSLAVRVLFIQFSVLSLGRIIVPRVVVNLLCPWQEVSSESFYTTILPGQSKQNKA